MIQLHDTARRNFFIIKWLYFCCLFFLTSSKIAAEINIVPDGKIVVLLSSKKRAKLDPSIDSINLANEKATKLCRIFNLSLKDLKLTMSPCLSFTNNAESVYQAEVPIVTREGLVFQSGIFPLIKYPSPVNEAGGLETVLYAVSGIIGSGGGLSSLGTYMGVGGRSDPEAARLIGKMTLGAVGACALLGAGCTLVRTARDMGKNIGNKNPIEENVIVAEPILATAIFCN